MARGKKVGSIYTEIRARLDKLDRDYRTAHTKSKSAGRKIQSAIDKITFKKASDSYRRFQRLFAVGLAGYGIKSLAAAALDVASSFEMMEIKLDALTRGRGKETLDELNTWALEMPVNTRKAVDTFVMMQAMGLDPTIAKMQTLTDVASIFGQEAMPRVARALGQMATLGRLSAEELNQMSEAGINARKYLTRAFGMTVEQLQKSQVSIEHIIDAIWQGLDADFAGAAQKAQRSWQGLTVTFKSYLEEMARQVMDAGVFEELKTQIDEINTRMKSWLATNRELIQVAVPVYLDKIKGGIGRLYDILTYDPDIIKWGLVGLLIWGKKGAAMLGGLSHLSNVIMVQAKAFKAWADGQISFGDIAKSNYTELKNLVDGLGQYSDGLAQAHGNVNRMGDALQKSHGQAKKLNDVLTAKDDVALPGFIVPDGKKLKDNIKTIAPLTDMWATFYDEQTRQASAASIKKAAVLQSYELASNEKTVAVLTDMWATFNDEQTRAASAASIAKAEALKSVSESAALTTDALVSSFSTATDHMSNALASFVTDGKFSFKGFADAVIGDLVRIQSRMVIMGLIKNIGGVFGGVAGSSPMDAFIMHGGGVVGATAAPSRSVPAMMFAGAPRLHRGLAGDEFPAILQKGETVLPKGAGGQTINNYYYYITALDSQDVFTAVKNSGAVPVLAAENLNDNGPLRAAMLNNL